MKLDRMTLRRGRRTPPATAAFVGSPIAIVRVETIARPDAQLTQLGIKAAEGTAWTLQAVSEELWGAGTLKTTSGALYGVVEKRTGTHVGVTPGYELQVRDPVMFTITLKHGGIETSRVTATVRPGRQRV